MPSVALRLLDAGYSAIPILVGEKRPAVTGWTRWCTELPTEQQVESWALKFRGCGWGIACGKVVAIDIDAEEPNRAAHLAGLAVGIFGPTPAVRIGRAPRRLLVYRSYGVVASRRIGDVEILAGGRQFVAVHIHPVTNKPYSWPVEHLADIPLHTLPAISADQVDQFLDRAAGQSKAERAGQARHGASNNDFTVDPTSGLVTEGREAWLARCVWRAYWEAIDAGDALDANALGGTAWQAFCATADLARPHGNRTWRRADAVAKARAIISKARAGRLAPQEFMATLKFVRLKVDSGVGQVSILDARRRLDSAIGAFFAHAAGVPT